ncbi:MAG: DsbA family protein [Silvanigrellaceae bacterium]|nr:DsbA family protein [Silvanigrellaceae bacterium]
MSSGKFIIGGIFIAAAVVGSIPLFFHDYKKIANNLTGQTSSTVSSSSKTATGTEVIGKYNSVTLKRSDLTTQELQTLFDAESQSYKAIENILAKRYFDNLIKEYMKSKNISNTNTAEQMFIQEKSTVTNEQVKQFVKENAENPQLKGKTPEQQEALVKPYLQNQAAGSYFRALVAQALSKGEIEVLGASKPVSPKINVEIGNSPSKGPADAPVTIVEFADFQCPFCATAQPIVEEVLKQYKGKVRYVFKNYPLVQIHPEAIPAAIAAECANKQNKYWQMHDALFENHKKLGDETYTMIAQKIGLKIEEFNSCRKDQAVHDKINSEMEYGQSLGINATPAFYINGVQLMGALPKSEFEKVINNELSIKN